ncbi:uncharacterized protein N7503_000004 [Penicillium pulvis]|uniref:uncharacterized protein n=1 Tax=Penicillium pulvis TaxID=1562058 RepID=UPI0025490FDA|nr:uncharacterized protein N7503_000004 [Penicillium pulvis]KAJ5813254.1 hypothetical protein N7503_000004 [Penicillium pulvis]
MCLKTFNLKTLSLRKDICITSTFNNGILFSFNWRRSRCRSISADPGKDYFVHWDFPDGLGAEFAMTISKHSPALLILANRNIERANDTAKRINVVSLSVSTRAYKLDLDLLNDIEHQFATNHIGQFLFTNLIMKKLTSEDGRWNGRVVNVSSNGYRLGPDGKTYDQWLAYRQSKTANMLFSISLTSKLARKGLVSVSLHPDAIPTNLFGTMGDNGVTTLSEDYLKELMAKDRAQGHSQYWLDDFFSIDKSISQGIATHMYAVFHDSVPRKYYVFAGLMDNSYFIAAEYNGRYFDDYHMVPIAKICY